MSSTYKDKILKEIKNIPDDKMADLYGIIHLFVVKSAAKIDKRGSLKGIWKGSEVQDSLFIEAKKSLFPF